MRIHTVIALTLCAVSALAQNPARKSPVAPNRDRVRAAIQEAYEAFKNDAEGKNADYIPALARVDSKLWGIAAVTTDGEVFTVGDTNHAFSIQSISKMFTLALALEEHGAAKVLERIGNEPTGRPFNSLTALDDMPGHTSNPAVNAGAIATTSLISGATADARWNKILGFYSKAAGERLSLIEEVYKSEAATNLRNRGIAFALANWERIYSDPLETVDIYTKQCSVGVTAKQLAMMGAMLANNGIHPISGEILMRRENIPRVLAAMLLNGLYDGSGNWAWTVGIPAKSGVGGAILAVVPGKGAIVGFAPPLDQAGNSVKAQKALRFVAERLGVNLLSPQSVGIN